MVAPPHRILDSHQRKTLLNSQTDRLLGILLTVLLMDSIKKRFAWRLIIIEDDIKIPSRVLEAEDAASQRLERGSRNVLVSCTSVDLVAVW